MSYSQGGRCKTFFIRLPAAGGAPARLVGFDRRGKISPPNRFASSDLVGIVAGP
jgi:hypothetical protein